ncbi:DUF5134 domain-containing protein [Tessaracoccus caeni]|uniref:DUF5134 domain-containing protein n=1 Tax=Tessaracoccus caeni TaxID=3031239 RepID=UPI0023DC435C|nr:DUF5134 domain-containing protein [Tessaracoccus caeni]MDF1489836.1 DUF5134 domain-containing protein [Tessaracoccus caeni]
MLTTPAVQWLFSASFAVLAGYTGFRAADRRVGGGERAGQLWHVVMCLVMAAMVWRWWQVWPWVPQLILFIAASVWFAGVALARTNGVISDQRWGHHPIWHDIVHLIMMLAMVWMIAIMRPSGDDHDHSGHALAPASVLSGVALVAAMVVAALVELVDLVVATRARRSRGPTLLDPLAMIVMLAGMSAMSWIMLVP